MKIGIIGSRGIPNHYGGFEECAQQLSGRLVKMGHEVHVYCSHRHPYQQKEFDGAGLIHKYDPEHRIGTAGQFIYDLNCIIDARWRSFDIILQLGYTSSSIWSWLMPKKSRIITNMDGLEWKRTKYGSSVRKFLKRAEKWAARSSHLLIADSEGIRDHIDKTYKSQTVYIPYGAGIFKNIDEGQLANFGVKPREFNMVVARLEPENNLEMILSGVQLSNSDRICLVVGRHDHQHGRYLKRKYRDSRIRFIGGIYDKEAISNLRFFSNIYLHGHSVGGTNPALLEAMACQSMICAHDNVFNREVLGEEGNFFMDPNDVANAIDLLERNEIQERKIKANLNKIDTQYNWDTVAEQYELVFQQALV